MSVKKILVISWHFPPYKSSSAFNLFKRFKDTGFDYDVIQIGRNHLPDNEGMFLYSNSKFTRYEISVPNEDSRNIESREFYVSQVIDLVQSLMKKNHYSAMLSHSHEMASHLAALKIKELYSELPWAASFGDPIAANPYNKEYNFPLIDVDSVSETMVLQNADKIIVTNDYQRDLVIQTQAVEIKKSKFFTLPHCFDRRMYHKQSHNTNSTKFRFMHVGMLYKFKRTSEPFLLGAQRLLAKHPHLKDTFTIEFYGANDKYIKNAAEYGLEDIVTFEGNVDYLSSLSIMLDADCLLLRDADFTDQGLENTPFYPGKLADYLGAKKPIIAVTMEKGCVPDMLSTLGGKSLTEEDIDGIADAMYQAINGNLSINLPETEKYSYENISILAKEALSFPQKKVKVLIAGHDLKFAKYLMEEIEFNDSYELLIDQWQGHDKHDEEKSLNLLNQADVIFCEWGLGNLVWYANHKKSGQKLITRIHAQELRTRHLDRCNHQNIDNYIFVSPYYFELMIHEFGLERSKCKMIFNMVDNQLLNKPKLDGSEFSLGMIGDVPQSKRLDKALDLFEQLYTKDQRYKLYIKGKRPEEYSWMHSKAKADEMAFYQKQYDRIKNNGWENNVIFDGYGPIDEWLRKIGWIISVSDAESFHLAVAEGMASGATPLILNWPGSEYIYDKKYIKSNLDGLYSILLSENRFYLSVIPEKFNKNILIAQILKLFN